MFKESAMWVVKARKSVLANVITLVLLSILAGVIGGGLVGMVTKAKPATPSAGQRM